MGAHSPALARTSLTAVLAISLLSWACADRARPPDDATNNEGGGGQDGLGGSGGKPSSPPGGQGGDADGGAAGGVAGGGGGAAGEGVVHPEYAEETPPEGLSEFVPLPELSRTLPGKLTFKSPSDLGSKFFLRKGEAEVDTSGQGTLKVAPGRSALLVYDSKPDEIPTDIVSEFTASIRFRSEGSAGVWFNFLSDRNRNDAVQISFSPNKGRVGPPGVSDVDSVHSCRGCWLGTLGTTGGAMNTCAVGVSCNARDFETYAWTHLEPSDWTTLRITVRPMKREEGGAAVLVETELRSGDDDALVDRQTTLIAPVARTVGELAVGIRAGTADVLVDEIDIRGAADFAPAPPIVTAPGGDLHMWLPASLRGKGNIKGALMVDPGLVAGADSAQSFFAHFRRFASAHGWALLGGGKNLTTTAFLAELSALGTITNHPELSTVPVFANGLLSTFPYRAHLDPEMANRLIGFFADKIKPDVNEMDMPLPYAEPTALGLTVPGLFVYSQTSLVSNRAMSEATFKLGRRRGAPWGLASHGRQVHAVADSWVLALPYLQELIALRMPNHQAPMLPIDQTKGFLVSNKGILLGENHVVSMEAHRELPEAELDTYSLVPGLESATVLQAFHYYRFATGPDGKIVLEDGQVKFDPKRIFWQAAPRHGSPGEDRTLRLGIADGLDWDKIEVYEVHDGVHLRKTFKRGDTNLTVTFTALAAGAHTFIARMWTTAGVEHVTHPVVAIMGSED